MIVATAIALLAAAAESAPGEWRLFSPVAMKPEKGVPDVWAAELPAEFTDADFEYDVEAFDAKGNGPSRHGTPSFPHAVRIRTGAAIMNNEREAPS